MRPVKAQADTDRFALVDISRLRVGSTLSHSILEDMDDRQVVLVGSGVTLTVEHSSGLSRRGITQVRVSRSDLQRLVAMNTTDRSRPVRVPTDQASLPAIDSRVTNALGRTRPVDSQMVRRFVESDNAATHQLDELFKGLDHGDTSNADQVHLVSRINAEQFAADRDAFLLSSILPGTEYSLSRHSLQVSKIATAIAVTMGRSLEEIAELNIGCLIHDVGMQRINQQLLESPRALSEMEYLEITKHPGITFELIRSVRSLSAGA